MKARHHHIHSNGAHSTEFDRSAGHELLLRRNRFGRLFGKLVLLLAMLPIVVLAVVALLLLYVFHEHEFSGETLNAQIVNTLQEMVGEAYRVEIDRTGISLKSMSLLALNADHVTIFKKGTESQVASLSKVRMGVEPLSVLNGELVVNDLDVAQAGLDLSLFASPASGRNVLKKNLTALGTRLSQLADTFNNGSVKLINVQGLELKGVGLMRRNGEETLELSDLVISSSDYAGISIAATVNTGQSRAQLSSSWQPNQSGSGYLLSAGIGPLNSREWLPPADPLAALAEESNAGFGLHTAVRLDARIMYNDVLQAVRPFLKLQAQGGELRLGRQSTVPVEQLLFEIRKNLDSGAVSLERGEIDAGGLSFEVTGTANPIGTAPAPQIWSLGFVARNFAGDGPLWATEGRERYVSVGGTMNAASKLFDLDSIELRDGSNSGLKANAKLAFAPGTSPSITGSASAPRLAVSTLQRFWPLHITPNLRNWIQTRLLGGALQNLAARFSFEQGRLREISSRKDGFQENEFALSSDVENLALKTFGSFPDLEGAKGTIAINGRKFVANAMQARITAANGKPVSVGRTDFLIADMFSRPVPAQLATSMKASLSTMAFLANAEPLSVADTMGVKPANFSGDGEAKISAEFPLKRDLENRDVQWNADLTLKDAASKTAFFGQEVSNADVSITAVPTLVTAKGTAIVDGFEVDLDISEPINGGQVSKRFRTITASLDHRELVKLGIDISAIVTGKMAVQVKTGAEGRDRYEVDLKNTDVSLPWISWLKGKGIPATASFVHNEKDGINTLSDFEFTGKSFKASGKLSFDKTGLVSAKLHDVVLARGDLFNVGITRKKNLYLIKITGRSFDGRSIINKIIHGDGVDDEMSNAEVSLSANLGKLTGFNQQVMENALITYQTNNGRLVRLDVRGAIDGNLATIDATGKGKTTTFKFTSDNAGGALAIVDLYRKMEGGRLSARLERDGNGPFTGSVAMKDFVIAGEERLKSLVAAPAENRRLKRASGKLQELNVKRVVFDDLKAGIIKNDNFFGVEKGWVRNAQIGLAFDGTIYDQNEQMSVRGTFMPLFALSRLIGEIPIIGNILSNGKNQGLIGVTYRLKGPAKSPTMLVNPISIIAPGIFKELFQFQK